jgi:hypothetical protein
MADEPIIEGDALSEEELSEAGPLIEATSRLIVPKRGKLFESDGSVGICIIRPCISRGRRLRGLPPIYTPRMLSENASVFGGWHMFMDHLSEQVVEAVRKRERSIRELGGRVLVEGLHFDHEFRRRDDDDFGYKPGAVVGRAIPQPPVRAMLEADPEILHTSINAWPTGAREGKMWGAKGMLVEGIRRKPQGSVDWVLRGGAGGHVLAEDEALAVSLLEAYYDAAPDDMARLDEITMEELAEAVKDRNPKLHEQLTEAMKAKGGSGEPDADDLFGKGKKGAKKAKPGTSKVRESEEDGEVMGITEEQLSEALSEQAKQFETTLTAKLAERDEAVEERAQELLAERAGWESLEEEARKLIERAGLPPTWTEQLHARYTVLPSGPAPGLANLKESEDDDGKKVTLVEALRESVKRDVEHAAKMIREAGGTAVVRGMGGVASNATGDGGGTTTKVRESVPDWRRNMHFDLKEGDSEDDALAEALREGML